MASGTFGMGFAWDLTWQYFYANPAALSVVVTPPAAGAHISYYLTRIEFFYRRTYGSTVEPWQSIIREYTPPTASERRIDTTMNLHHNWYAQCYFRCHYQIVWEAGYGESYASIYFSPLHSSLMVDNADPTLAATLDNALDGGDVVPFTGGMVQWNASLTDDVEVRWLELYVDDVWVQRQQAEVYRTSLSTSLSKSGLTKGAHSVRIVGTDYAMRTDEYSDSFTVGNGPPSAPPTLAVNGRTSSIRVGRAQEHTVTWGAATDPNPEDSITAYELQEREPEGEWTMLADDLAVLTYAWTPDVNGTWGLRVRASDGTAWGAWTTLTGITVVSSAAPNAPTITDPS